MAGFPEAGGVRLNRPQNQVDASRSRSPIDLGVQQVEEREGERTGKCSRRNRKFGAFPTLGDQLRRRIGLGKGIGFVSASRAKRAVPTWELGGLRWINGLLTQGSTFVRCRLTIAVHDAGDPNGWLWAREALYQGHRWGMRVLPIEEARQCEG